MDQCVDCFWLRWRAHAVEKWVKARAWSGGPVAPALTTHVFDKSIGTISEIPAGRWGAQGFDVDWRASHAKLREGSGREHVGEWPNDGVIGFLKTELDSLLVSIVPCVSQDIDFEGFEAAEISVPEKLDVEPVEENQSAGIKRKGGRPPQHDWKAFHIEVARYIQKDPDGLPLVMADMVRHIQSWFQSAYGKEPAKSLIEDKLRPYYQRIMDTPEN